MKLVHSATGLVLPGTSIAPPMTTQRPILSRRSGPFTRNACAKLVSGPRAMYVTVLPGLDSIRSRITSTPGLSVNCKRASRLTRSVSRSTSNSGWREAMSPSPSLFQQVSDIKMNCVDKNCRTCHENIEHWKVRLLEDRLPHGPRRVVSEKSSEIFRYHRDDIEDGEISHDKFWWCSNCIWDFLKKREDAYYTPSEKYRCKK